MAAGHLRVTEVTLIQQIASVAREIAIRERFYPYWVQNGKMTRAEADRELAAMRAVLETLKAAVKAQT